MSRSFAHDTDTIYVAGHAYKLGDYGPLSRAAAGGKSWKSSNGDCPRTRSVASLRQTGRPGPALVGTSGIIYSIDEEPLDAHAGGATNVPITT